jgi:hypothetical protein
MPKFLEPIDQIIQDENNNNGKTDLVYHDLFKKFGNWNICFLPKHYSSHSDYIKKFNVRNDDLWVVSFIKAGKNQLSI